MSSLTRRLEAIEMAKEKQDGFRLVVRKDGESDSEAKARVGLADWPGVIIFLDELDRHA